MLRKSVLLSVILVTIISLVTSSGFASTRALPESKSVNDNGHPRHHRRHAARRHRNKSIKHDYADAGKSAGHGGKELGKNVRHGRPVKGGKEFGKGMGNMGKGVGHGTKKVGKTVGSKVKHAVTP